MDRIFRSAVQRFLYIKFESNCSHIAICLVKQRFRASKVPLIADEIEQKSFSYGNYFKYRIFEFSNIVKYDDDKFYVSK